MFDYCEWQKGMEIPLLPSISVRKGGQEQDTKIPEEHQNTKAIRLSRSTFQEKKKP